MPRPWPCAAAIAEILASLPAELHGVGQTRALAVLPGDQHGDLPRRGRSPARPGRRRSSVVERVAARHGLRLFWGGTHPFSRWQDQEVTPNDRYLQPDRPAPGDSPAAGDLRPARPRRGRLGRQGDHDLRPDHAAPADAAGPFGQQPVLAGAEYGPAFAARSRSWRPCRPRACPP